jgi:hypothetical protein
MSRVIEKPQSRKTVCSKCGSVIEYFPEEIKEYLTPYTFFHDSQLIYYIKCPNSKCFEAPIIVKK